MSRVESPSTGAVQHGRGALDTEDASARSRSFAQSGQVVTRAAADLQNRRAGFDVIGEDAASKKDRRAGEIEERSLPAIRPCHPHGVIGAGTILDGIARIRHPGAAKDLPSFRTDLADLVAILSVDDIRHG